MARNKHRNRPHGAKSHEAKSHETNTHEAKEQSHQPAERQAQSTPPPQQQPEMLIQSPPQNTHKPHHNKPQRDDTSREQQQREARPQQSEQHNKPRHETRNDSHSQRREDSRPPRHSEQQRSEQTGEQYNEQRNDNRSEQRNEQRGERPPHQRGERRNDYNRSEQRGEQRSDNRRSHSRPSPSTPDFIPIGGGFERPEQYARYAAEQEDEPKEAYEPYVPKTPARGSDDIFYKDFDPLYKGARGLAIKILSRLEQSDSYLDKLLEYELAHSDLKPLDRALLTEIVNGVTRWQAKLDWVLTGFYHGEFVKCIMPVKNAMRIALYQIMFLQKIPPFAAVNESVELVKRLKGPRSANLVNAILRNILHNLGNIRYPNRHEDASRHFSVLYSHPFWMTKRWYDRFGEADTEQLLKMNNERPKINLRLNIERCNREELLQFLTQQDIKYWESTLDAERFLQVGSLSAVREWKPFRDGWFAVQDPSAAMVVKLANPQAGQRIYDVCAAPGGKATFAAELTGDKAEILAMDKYGGKLHLIEETAQRLGLKSITTQAQDVRHFKTKDLADLVMVDAPCSGLGTLAKKPDIKWKFDLTAFPPLVKTQREILTASARLVKPGGTLVYSTCTIEPEENEKQVEWFLQQFPEFSLDPAESYIPQELCSNGFLQTFPHKHHCDGAFAARLVKKK